MPHDSPSPQRPRLTLRERLRVGLARGLTVGAAGVVGILVAKSVEQPPSTTSAALTRAFLILVAVMAPLVIGIVVLLRSEKKDRRD